MREMMGRSWSSKRRELGPDAAARKTELRDMMEDDPVSEIKVGLARKIYTRRSKFGGFLRR